MDETPPEAPTARHRRTQTKAEMYDVRLKARLLFHEMNNQAAWRAFAKWLKHSRKHSNETVDKRLAWHTISNHRTVILNIHLPEMPEMSNMSELDK